MNSYLIKDIFIRPLPYTIVFIGLGIYILFQIKDDLFLVIFTTILMLMALSFVHLFIYNFLVVPEYNEYDIKQIIEEEKSDEKIVENITKVLNRENIDCYIFSNPKLEQKQETNENEDIEVKKYTISWDAEHRRNKGENYENIGEYKLNIVYKKDNYKYGRENTSIYVEARRFKKK